MKPTFVIGWSKMWIGISATIILASLVCVAIFGFNFGIDFTGGTILEVQLGAQPTTEEVRHTVASTGIEPIVQTVDTGSYTIRAQEVSREEHDAILAALETDYGSAEELHFESIGPVIGDELRNKAILAVVILLVLIVLYVAWAFRQVSQPVASWKYAVLTIVAAMHDVIIPAGVFAVLGKFYGFQIDSAFIAAILTILGYSINDTIVIFDRVRENLVVHRHSEMEFAELVDNSVRQSFVRSINTSMTTILVLLAILIFGGETTKPFVLALIIGIAAGTYSSIFVASPLLVEWHRWAVRRKEK